MIRFVLFTLLAVCAVSASAADDSTAVVTKALHKLAPNAKIESVTPAPLAGFYAVVVDGRPASGGVDRRKEPAAAERDDLQSRST